jgi:hypothetical protein
MGKHTNPRRNLSALREEFKRWDRAARRLGLAWSDWARAAMDEKRARDEKTEPKGTKDAER